MKKNYAIIGQFINMNRLLLGRLVGQKGFYNMTLPFRDWNDKKNNSKSEIIFIINEENEISLLEEVNTLLANPIFTFSNAETLRMKI